MTEEEWLVNTDPTPMLEFLRDKASDRKLRLFACACCRRVWNLLSDKYNRKALTIAERYADGEVTEEKLGFAWGDARRASQAAHRQDRETAEGTAMWAVSLVCEAGIDGAVAAVGLAARCEAYPSNPPRLADAQREQLSLLRCIFGDPFHPVAIDPYWLTPTVTMLATVAYEERGLHSGELAAARLAVLADALEETGCTDEAMLAHLRGPGPHVRGCWPLDLVLGKE